MEDMEMTELEKAAENERNSVISSCDTLYSPSDYRRCGCRCWECGDGWIQPLKKLSYELEYMNRTEGRRFGLKIRADQVKEKFGMLRFYHSILFEYPWWTRTFSFPFHFLSGFLERHVDFGYRWKRTPTKNLFLYSMKTACERAGNFLDLSFLVDSSRGKDFDVAMEHFRNKTNDLIQAATMECYDMCEVCGTLIGGRFGGFGPRCETKGWIRYVCKRCAEKNGWEYEEVKGKDV